MTLGQKLKRLRSKKELTQKDLAESLNVSFQTVSKWENDENEPDLATIKHLAKLFDCSTDYLLSEEEEEEVNEEPTAVTPVPAQPEPAPIQQQTIIIHQKEPHVCTRCKKDIPEGELEIDHVPHRERHGRHFTTTYTDAYYHRDCLALTRKERADAAMAAKKTAGNSAKKRCFGWGIFGGIVVLIIAMIVMLTVARENIHPALGVFLSILMGYAVFADIYCILSGSYIGDVFLGVASWSIKFPGVIFTLDLGGLAFLIAVKILFAILGFFLGVFVFFLAVALSGALAAISFPFVLIHNNKTLYEDAL